ncbi:MAG: ATP-binding cassette domain-containing protein [Methanobacteriaceae archaeon]|nr:ATP-binding cassette domain-containing protein [Methanobacteriaceae archaeon]
MTNFIIEAHNIGKNFDGLMAVDGLNLKIRKGEVFGFLGPNGAGKTTSISIMVGLLKPNTGQVFINSKDVKEIDRGIIGICPQELVLWEHLTCKESLMLMGEMYEVPKDLLKSRVDKLLKDLILEEKANTTVEKLSGGMKRRLNLALALVHEPDIVVLDEPSEGLDPQSRRVLWNYILSLRNDQDKTVILTTHLMDEADRLSDRIAIIDHGRLLKLDTPENLKKEIGEGDIVDIKTSNPKKNKELIENLSNLEQLNSAIEVNGRINVRALDAVSKLPLIMDKVEKVGVRISELSVRQNTLEDVFIELTGTGLRE